MVFKANWYRPVDVNVVRQQLERGQLTLGRDECQRAIAGLFHEQETHDVLSSMFGTEFFHTLKAAPWEYAALTFYAHLGAAIPCMAFQTMDSTSSSFEQDVKMLKELNQNIMDVYGLIYDKLAPSLASANHGICELGTLKSASWHGLVGQYVTLASEVLETSITAGTENAKKYLESAEGQKEVRWARNKLRKEGDFDAAQFRSSVMRAAREYAIANLVKTKGLTVASATMLQTLAINMQQELPRAWAFKYGSGKNDFLKFEDATLVVIESCIVPGRAVAPRNAFFVKCKQEGLGPARTAKKWNGMSIDARRRIAPKAPGNVTESAVKKAIQRERRQNRDES